MTRSTQPRWKTLRTVSVLLLAGPLLGLVCGCASWSTWGERGDDPVADRLPTLPLRKIARSIELETRFIQIKFDPADPDQLQSIWQWVDETVVRSDKRGLINRNGLRIGKVFQPDRLIGRLESLKAEEMSDVVDTFLASAAVSSHHSEGGRIDPMRIGKRNELPVRLPIEGVHVPMIYEHGEVIARSLLDPTFLIAVTPQQGQSSSEIRLTMRPEIQHGDMRQDWVKGDAALRIDVRRQSWSLDSLEFELVGGEGDLFIVSETATRRGLGQMMLGGKNVDQMEQQTVLLIRIANVPTPAEKF